MNFTCIKKPKIEKFLRDMENILNLVEKYFHLFFHLKEVFTDAGFSQTEREYELCEFFKRQNLVTSCPPVLKVLSKKVSISFHLFFTVCVEKERKRDSDVTFDFLSS